MRMIISDVNLIDGTGSGLQPFVHLVIEDDQLVEVLSSDLPQEMGNTKVMNGNGRWALPGLFDLHVHIATWHGQPDVDRYKTYQPAKAAVLGAKRIHQTLMGGVTTLRDLGTAHGVAIALKEAIEKGQLMGSRILPSDKIICVTGGHGHDVEGMSREADGPDDVRQAVREQLRAGADLIKICNTHRAPLSEFTQEELQAIVSEAHRNGVLVACHVGIEPGYQMAVRAGIDTVEHGNLPSDETIALMAERGTYWVPTVSVSRGLIDGERANMTVEQVREAVKERVEKRDVSRRRSKFGIQYMTESFRRSPEVFQKMREAGVPIACGTDVDASQDREGALPMDAAKNEMKWFVRFGMTPEEAIVAATATSARAAGIGDWVGTLKKGKVADIILLERDPLDDIDAIDTVSAVIKEGVIVRDDA